MTTPRPGGLSVAAGTGRLKWEQRLEKAGGARPGGRAAGERDPGGAARVRAQRRPRSSPGRGERRREPAAARHHAARGAAGGRPGIYRALSVLHEPWGGHQCGSWEREGNPSQPGQEKRRRRTRRAERVMHRGSSFGVGLPSLSSRETAGVDSRPGKDPRRDLLGAP